MCEYGITQADPSRWVLVLGLSRSIFHPLPHALHRSVAVRVGRELARLGFCLVTGNTPGVDRDVAQSFWDQCLRLGRDPKQAYRQLHLPIYNRGSRLPMRGFHQPEAQVEWLKTEAQWACCAVDVADAAIMIGGSRGSLGLAQAFIEAGKPVFPIPFVGGGSRHIFESVLSDWCDVPVPGLRRSQFLRLAVPWKGSGVGPLRNLLLGVLDNHTRVFISYRRADSGWTTARIQDSLAEELGERRIFHDIEDIRPTTEWDSSIKRALAECEVGLMVIGKNYMLKGNGGVARIEEKGDVVRREVMELLALRKPVVPVLVDGAGTETLDQLPEELKDVRAQQAVVLDPNRWLSGLRCLLDAIEDVLVVPDAARVRKVQS